MSTCVTKIDDVLKKKQCDVIKSKQELKKASKLQRFVAWLEKGSLEEEIKHLKKRQDKTEANVAVHDERLSAHDERHEKTEANVAVHDERHDRSDERHDRSDERHEKTEALASEHTIAICSIHKNQVESGEGARLREQFEEMCYHEMKDTAQEEAASTEDLHARMHAMEKKRASNITRE